MKFTPDLRFFPSFLLNLHIRGNDSVAIHPRKDLLLHSPTKRLLFNIHPVLPNVTLTLKPQEIINLQRFILQFRQ